MHSEFPRNVLYVHYQTCPTDGSAVHVQQFCEEFGKLALELGLMFEVIAPPQRMLEAQNSPIQDSIRGRLRAWLGRNYLRELKVPVVQWIRSRQELAMLSARRPDLVITRYDAETLSIHWACQRLNIPVVTEFNGRDRGELASTYAAFKQFDWANRLFSNCHALSLSAGAVSVTDAIAQPLNKCNSLGKPIMVNHNGVDLSEFDYQLDGTKLRAKLGISSASVVIGYVGSFIVWHDPQRLLRVFSTLRSEGLPVSLLLVGRKVAQVEDMIATLPETVRSNIHLVGLIPHEQVPEYLAAMDIAVLPQTQAYCSPLKLFEYMAMGRACVAPATDGVCEILQDAEEGLLFDPKDEFSFLKALRQLATHPEQRIQLGKAARSRVAAEFTWRQNAERVMQTVNAAWQWHQHHQRIEKS